MASTKEYKSVEELPDLVQKATTQKTYNNVDELPDLKKKVGGEPVTPGSKDVQGGVLGGTISTKKGSIDNELNKPIVQIGDKKVKNNPLSFIEEYNNLENDVDVFVSGGTGGAAASTSKKPEAIKKQVEIMTILKDKGIDKDAFKIYQNVLNGLPKEAQELTIDGIKPYSNEELSKLGPIQLITKTNAVKTYFDIKAKSGTEEANKFARLQFQNTTQFPYNDIADFNRKKDEQKELITKSLSGDKLDKALKRVDDNSDIILNNAIPDAESAKGYLTNRLYETNNELSKKELELGGNGQFSGNINDYSLETIQSTLDPNNKADQIAFSKYKRVVDMDNAINSSPTLDDAAIKFARESNQNIDDHFGILADLPNSYKGEIVASFLNDPDIIKRAEVDPEFAKEYQKTAQNLYFNYPDYAKKVIATKISQGREDNDENNWFANVPTKEGTDKLVNQLVEEGKMTETEKLLYERDIREELGVWESVKRGAGRIVTGAFVEKSPIETPGLLESTQNSYNETLHGIARSVVDLYNVSNPLSPTPFTDEKRLYQVLNDKYSTSQIVPKTLLHEVSQGTGHLVGFFIPMLAGGGLMNGVKGGEFITNALMFEGHNRDKALEFFPKDPTKQYLYTGLSTAGDMLLTHIIPTKKINEGLGKVFKTDIKNIVTDLADKKITETFAKQTILEKAAKYFPELLKENTKTTGIMTGFGVFHNIVDNIFGQNDMGAGEIATEAVKTFKATFLTTPLLAAMAVHGKQSAMNGKILMEFAGNPEYFTKFIKDQSALHPELKPQEAESLANLKDLADIKAAIDKTNITEQQKQKYMVNAINQKILERKAEASSEDIIKADLKSKAEEFKKNKEAIYRGEDKATEYEDTELSEPLPDDFAGGKINIQGVPIGEDVPAPTQPLGSESKVKVYEYEGKKYEVSESGVVEQGTDNMKPLDFKEKLESKGTLLTTQAKAVVSEGDKPALKGKNENGSTWEEVVTEKDGVKTTRYKVERKDGKTIQEGNSNGTTGRTLSWDEFQKEFTLSKDDLDVLSENGIPEKVIIHETREGKDGRNGMTATFDFGRNKETGFNDQVRNDVKFTKPEVKGKAVVSEGDNPALKNNPIIVDMSLPTDSGVNTGLVKNSKGAVYHDRNTAKLKKLGYSDTEIDNFSQKEVDEILVKNIENPNVESSAKLPLAEKQTTTEEFTNEAIGSGGHFAELAKALRDNFGLGNIKTSIVKGLKDFFGKNNDGDYSNNQIRIDEKAKNKIQTFLHEGIHKVTVDKLLQFERGDLSKLSETDIDAIKNLKRIFEESKVKIHQFLGGGKGDRTNGHYGFTNVHEFISEAFTNPEFQRLLREIPTEGKSPTIFKQFLDAIAKFLGIKDASILNDIFHHTENLGTKTEGKAVVSEGDKQAPTEVKQPIANEKAEAPKDNKQNQDALPDNTKTGENIEPASKGTGGKEPPVDTKDLDKMASDIPNGGEVKKYLSGDTIKKYEGGELRNNQEIIAQELEPALRHGIETIDKAKEVFGDNYVEKTLEYIEREKLNPENKALLYVTLENDMAKRVLAEPDNLGLKKQQDLVRAKSQAYLRSNSLAINMGRLRKFAETGYDISKVTDKFFSSKELEVKAEVEKLVQADADKIQKAAEEAEVNKQTDSGITPDLEQKIKDGVDAEIAKIYEQLPKEKKTAVDKAIKALDNIHNKLRSKAYDATIGIPVAIIDMGVVTIRAALKAGVKAAKAVELGIEKIKEKWGKDWDKEDIFRKDYLNGLKEQGVLDAEYKKQAAKEYRMLETERNRQLEKVGQLKEKQKQLEQGIIEAGKKSEPKKDTPEIETLKAQNKQLEKDIREAKAEADRIEKKIASDRKNQIKKDNNALEAEAIRQITKVKELTEKRDRLQQGIRDEVKKNEAKIDTPEIEALKKEVAAEEKKLSALEATDNRVKNLETELQRLQDRKPKNTKVSVPKEITDKEIELKEKIAEEKKTIAKEVKENAAPKTRQERLADAKEALQKRIDEVRDQILTKRADAVKDKTPLNKDAEYQQMEAEYKALTGLKDKYLPKEGEKFVDEKKLKVAEKRIVNEIQEINKQIEVEQKNEKKKPDAVVSDNIKKLKTEKEARLAVLEAVDPTPKEFVQETLIENGFGTEVNIKTKTGVEQRTILDWKKLAGEEGSVDKIKANVEQALKDKGYTPEQIDRMAKKFQDEYNALRESIIVKGLNVVAERNKTTVTPTQKSAAKKLAEMYNYGLFDKNLLEYETALSRTIGVDKLSEANLSATITLGNALSKLYSTDFQGKRLTENQIKSAINVIEEHMRFVLNNEVKKHGSTSLKVADMARTYFDVTQRMALVTLKQGLENPFSGQLESLYTQLGYGTKGLNASARKLGKDIYKEMVLEKGYQYGDVSSTFVNKGSLEMGLHNLSDNKLLQGVVSTLIGKTSLDAVDSAYKAKITQQKFTHNLITILTKDRLINGKIEKGMSKPDAIKYVAESLTGQSFKDAQETARNIIKNVNEGSGQKIFNDSPLFVDRLANDIVNAALVNGEKITEEMVTASYNSAYRAAGRGLGHVANNYLSNQVGKVSGEIEAKINNAIKEKEYNKAAILTLESIFFRNIANPFVGGGTNWVVLKAEKTGLGLVSGLGSMMRRGGKMDLTSETGIKRLEQAMYENLKIKDKFIRGAVGGMTTVIAVMALQGITTTDEFKKWRDKNPWAKKYTDILTPEVWLAMFAKKDKKAEKYFSSSINRNDAFDKGKMAIQAATSTFMGSNDATAKAGKLAGSMVGVPIPWRLARDVDQLWVGASGGEPYKINNTKPETFMQGYFKGGMIDYLGVAPQAKPKTTFNDKTNEYLKQKNYEYEPINEKQIEIKEIQPDGKGIVKKLIDYTPEKQKEYIDNHTKFFEEELDNRKLKNYVYREKVYGGISLEKDDNKKTQQEYINLDKLTPEEFKKMISELKEKATYKTKQKMFPKEYPKPKSN